MEIKINQAVPEQAAEQPVVIYKCRINVRASFRGYQVREAILELNGFVVTLQCDGRIFDNETYPNEALFVPCTDRDRQLFWMYGLKYLAEGDVTILERLHEDQMPENLLSQPVDARKRRENSRH